MYFFASGQQQVRNPLTGIGLVRMFRLRQSVEEQWQVEAVVQFVDVHLGKKRRGVENNSANFNLFRVFSWEVVVQVSQVYICTLGCLGFVDFH